MRKAAIVSLFLIFLVVFSNISSITLLNAKVEPIAELELYTWPDEMNLALMIKQYLADINIDVEIRLEEGPILYEKVYGLHDYDLAVIGEVNNEDDPDRIGVFTENGSLNCYGLDTEIPYGQKNENMLRQGIMIKDLEERQQHYYDWQQLLMKQIVPILPLFAARSIWASWSNLEGLDISWELIDCLPYIYFDGLHEGQISTTELNLNHQISFNQNPLFNYDWRINEFEDLIMTRIIKLDPSGVPTTNALIEGWVDLGNQLFEFHLREGVYWNPSYNITSRTSDSEPLDSSLEEQLMVGLKGDYSNGTNQPVQAKDVVFTLLAWANPLVTSDYERFDWIRDIWIDDDDELTFYIQIDSDPETIEYEYYAPLFSTIERSVLPEFFLNSTDTTITTSSGGKKMIGIYDGIICTPQWRSYDASAFGSGMYMQDYYTSNIAKFVASPYWFETGLLDGTHQTLDIETINFRTIDYEVMDFKLGKLDFIDMLGQVEDLEGVKQDSRFDTYYKFHWRHYNLEFNLQKPFIGGEDNYEFLTEEGYENYTKACAVRKAICYAIDREEINDVLWDGLAYIIHCPIHPTQSFWYYDDIIKYDRNLELALKWLELAGYTIKTNTIQYPTTILIISIFFLFCYHVKKRKKF